LADPAAIGELSELPKPQSGFRGGGEGRGKAEKRRDRGGEVGEREGREKREEKGGMGVDTTKFGRKLAPLIRSVVAGARVHR